MNRLTRVQIENLACFGELSLVPGEFTLLLGTNGAGKSTLLDLLFDLRELINGRVGSSDVAFPDYAVGEGPRRLAIELLLEQASFRYELELQAPEASGHELSPGPLSPRWEIRRERLNMGERQLTDFVGGVLTSADVEGRVPLTKDRSPLATVAFPERSPVRTFKRWVDSVWLLRLEPQRMLASAEAPSYSLDVSGENFVSWILSFSGKKKTLGRVALAVRPSIAGLVDLNLERAGREWVLVASFESGAKVDFDALSDGQRCLIVLHAVIALVPRACSLLLLDEPDTHVTPTEILPLFTALRDQASRSGMQVMVSSHHPQVIDLLAPDTPWELVLRQGKVHAEPFRVDLDRGVPASRHLLLRGRR